MGQTIRSTFVCVARQGAPIHEQSLHNPLPSPQGEDAQRNNRSPADKWAGGALQPSHCQKTALLSIRTPERLGYVYPATEVRVQYPDPLKDSILIVQYNPAKRPIMHTDT